MLYLKKLFTPGMISLIILFIFSQAVHAEKLRNPESDRAYAAGLYHNLLGREPSRKELSRAMSDLRRVPARIAVHNRLLDSPGFRSLPRWEWRPPNGESLIEVQARALPAVLRIAQSSPDSDVVVVSHGGTVRALWAHAAGGWEETRTIPNGSLLVIPHDGTSLGKPDLREDGS